MKNVLQWIVVAAGVACWLAPLGAALFDGGCWFYLSRQCSDIEWNQARAAIVLGWTIVVPLFVAAVVGA